MNILETLRKVLVPIFCSKAVPKAAKHKIKAVGIA